MRKTNIQRKVLNQTPVFEKKYTDYSRLKKVLTIHSLLEEIGFRYSLPILHSDNEHIYQHWCEPSRIANYRLKEDRLEIIKVIQNLHATNKQITWDKVEEIPSYSLRKKWGSRIQRFEKEQRILENLFPLHFDQCLRLAKSIFSKMAEQNYPEKLTLIHGDLAHHNFLLYKNKWYIIDFDLAHVGYANQELLSWVQRLLPFVDYNLLQLIEEMPALQQIAPHWEWLAFPNEEMREMLYYCHLEGKDKEDFRPFLERFLRAAQSKREFLQQQIQTML